MSAPGWDDVAHCSRGKLLASGVCYSAVALLYVAGFITAGLRGAFEEVHVALEIKAIAFALIAGLILLLIPLYFAASAAVRFRLARSQDCFLRANREAIWFRTPDPTEFLSVRPHLWESRVPWKKITNWYPLAMYAWPIRVKREVVFETSEGAEHHVTLYPFRESLSQIADNLRSALGH